MRALRSTRLLWLRLAVLLAGSWRIVQGSHAEPKSPPAFSGMRLQPCAWNHKTEFTDARDGHVYRQVEIGGQCWMASNLSFGKRTRDMDQRDNQVPECTCHSNDSVFCAAYGGLYTWPEATAYASPAEIAQGGIQGLCPDGWHLPSDAEWTQMEKFLDPAVSNAGSNWRGQNIAHRLIGSDPLWTPAASIVDASNFNALPAGNAVSGWFFYLGRGAYFWTASPYSAAAAWSRGLTAQVAQVFRGPGDKLMGFSVRCVKD